LRPELDATDVAQPRDFARAAGLDDDCAKLIGVAELARDIERVLEGLAGGRGRHPDLAGGYPRALLLQGLRYILRHQGAGAHLLRVEPDAHGILAGAEHVYIADAGEARNLVLEPDGRIVREIEAVIARVRRGQGDDLQDGGRVLLHDDAL